MHSRIHIVQTALRTKALLGDQRRSQDGVRIEAALAIPRREVCSHVRLSSQSSSAAAPANSCETLVKSSSCGCRIERPVF